MEHWCGIDREKEIVIVEREGSLHVMLFCDGSAKLSGRGQCGACVALELQAFSLDKSGTIRHLFGGSIADWIDGNGVQSIVDSEKTCFGIVGYSYDPKRYHQHELKGGANIEIWCWDKIQKTYRQLSYTQPR